MARERRRRGRRSEPTWRGTVLGSGPRMVLVHGGPGLDHHLLLPLAEQLAPSFEVWLPDLAGHGADPQRTNPTLAHTLKQLGRAVEHAGGCDLLVGHSLGAWLVREGLRRGLLHPRSGTVLLAPPAGRRPRIRPRRVREAQARLAPAILEQVHAETGAPATERFADALQSATLRPLDDHQHLLADLAHALARPTARIRTPVPALVCCGADDSVVRPLEAEELARLTAPSRFALLPEVGHYPAATGDDGVARAILSFAEGLSVDGSAGRASPR